MDSHDPSNRADPACHPVPGVTVVIPCFNERPNVRPMVAALGSALAQRPWEAVFVDDDSPDGTWAEAKAVAASDPRIRCIRRIGRRGLASAVVEGALSSSAELVAVIDGDGQHDEAMLPAMLGIVGRGEADVAVASRFAPGGDASGLSGGGRLRLSGVANAVARAGLRQPLTDPMSGFFVMRRDALERLAPGLTCEGFKVLLDILLTARGSLRVSEVGARFRPRAHGESKLTLVVALQLGAMLADKALGGRLPLRFLSFAMVGAFGMAVHLAALASATVLGMDFYAAQAIATVLAMAANFEVNNRVTYRDRRLAGRRLAGGFALFMAACGVGAAANVGIAYLAYAGSQAGRVSAGLLGAGIGVVWNYAISSTLVWGRASPRRVA